MSEIPYDEMRRLCGLPDVRGYVARREFARMGEQIGEALKRAAIVWTEALEALSAAIEGHSRGVEAQAIPTDVGERSSPYP